MYHTISNELFTVKIQHKGVELASLKSKITGLEYMWNANPDIWGSHAPVLFPAIGSFKNGICTINGINYKIPKHGFIRHNNQLQLIEENEHSLLFELNYSDELLKIYPYKFRFLIRFELNQNELIVSHTVENLDDKDIYFALGGHPAFKCPWNSNDSYENYYLEFEKTELAERTLLSDAGLISDKTELVLDNTNKLELSKDLFNQDALIFKNLKSKSVCLKNKNSKNYLKISYYDFDYLGIWAKPNAEFVCIEPWLGIADHENTDGNFLKKDGIQKLGRAKEFISSYTITIKE